MTTEAEILRNTEHLNAHADALRFITERVRCDLLDDAIHLGALLSSDADGAQMFGALQALDTRLEAIRDALVEALFPIAAPLAFTASPE